MRDAVVVSTARTGLAKSWRGAFNMTHGATMGAHAVSHAITRARLDPGEIDDVLIGCAFPEGATGSNIARQVALRAGCPVSVPGMTVNRFCSSGLQTIALAAQRIVAGEGDVFVAGGVETVSRFDKGKSDGMPDTKNPRFAEAQARTSSRAEGGKATWTPAAGLPDLYIGMGFTAENVAELENVSRLEMDEFAASVEKSAKLEKVNDAKFTLTLGENNWPFPIPIVKEGNEWRFDTQAGTEEVLNRRIGENELSAILSCRAYVLAQWQYFTNEDEDNDGTDDEDENDDDQGEDENDPDCDDEDEDDDDDEDGDEEEEEND